MIDRQIGKQLDRQPYSYTDRQVFVFKRETKKDRGLKKPRHTKIQADN